MSARHQSAYRFEGGNRQAEMDQILQQIGQTIGDVFGNPVVQLAFRGLAIYFVVLWLAGAYWAFRDLQGRTDNAIVPYLAASLVIVFTPLFFPLAIVVYRIIRPHERIGDVNERSLAEEALLNEVESVAHCPGCSRRVNEDWLICPTCRTRLHRVCPNCSRLVGLDWSLCAWCGKDFERREAPRVIAPVPIPARTPIDEAPPAVAQVAASPQVSAIGSASTQVTAPVQVAAPIQAAPSAQVVAARPTAMPVPGPAETRPVRKRGIRGPGRTAPDPLPER